MSANNIPDIKDLIKSCSKLFYEHFNSKPSICGCAPGRVNLIGEHTDYNEGFVLPMALPLVTVVVGRRNNSKECHMVTACPYADEPRKVKFDILFEDSSKKLLPGRPTWANYVKRVIANFKGKLFGFEAVISTSVPVGVGLSSSAALEVAMYSFLVLLSDEPPPLCLKEKILACQKAEHEYPGMPCGIMDQFISFMGKKDHALLLDCRSLKYFMIELKDPKITVLITNTNVRHNLAESQYSSRKKQCETAVQIIGKSSLRDVSFYDLNSHKESLGEEIYRRALHVVGEIQRTKEAANALKEEKYEEFGKLMIQSHESLRDNYEVSCNELNTVVEAALEVEGVYGSRMTGGGFGGCTVTLLKTDAVLNAMQNIKEKYNASTFYVCRPGEGAQCVRLPA